MSEDRAAALAAVAAEIRACTACRLYEGTKNAVPGYGDPQAEILFIGEGPGFNEDQQGLPFVGKSGRYLDYLLELIQLTRAQVFITNVVKHRPPDNRDPAPDEIIACKAYLDRQIALLDPLLIVTLGRFSMERYFPGGKISAIHGKPKYDGERAYLPLFHPAAALRNPALRHDMEADIKRIPEVLAEVKRRRTGHPAPPEAPEARPAETKNPPPPKADEPPRQLKLF